MISFSYSKIRAWNECPKSYELTYLEKVGRDEGDPLILGSAAHQFFQSWVESFINAQIQGWPEIALKCWASEPRDQNLYQEYLSICEKFVEHFDFNEIPKEAKTICELEIALDKDLNRCDWMSENVWFRGKIDRIDMIGNTAIITDYKSSFKGKTDAFQGFIYAWLTSIIYPEITNFKIIIHYIRSDWKEKYEFSKEKLSGIEFQIKAITETIEGDNKFKAKPGSRCSSCLVAFSCLKKGSTIKSITNENSAKKIAGDILAAEAQLESKKDLLKAWVSENGEVKLNGETFSFFPYETWKGDTKELVSVLTDNNIEPWGYLKTDTKEIKKLCKTDDTLANSLAQALTISSTLRFTHKKDE